MSWESYSLMKCKKCGKVYEVEESTLIINQTGYDKCPLCHYDGEVITLALSSTSSNWGLSSGVTCYWTAFGKA